MRLRRITDTADGLKVEYSYETDMSELDYLPNDNAAIRYPDGSIHAPYMARLPEEGEDIDVSLGGFLVFDAVLDSGSVDMPMASVSDDGTLNPQPELLVVDRRYGVAKLIYEDEYNQKPSRGNTCTLKRIPVDAWLDGTLDSRWMACANKV